MALTFRGGIAPAEKKEAERRAIEAMPAPEKLTIVFSPEKGENALVKPGDSVLFGERLTGGEGDGIVPVHAPVSGTVREVNGGSIELENDHKNTPSPEISPFTVPISEASKEDLIEKIRLAGVTDFGRKEEPLALLLQKAKKTAKRLIINCVESEPELSASHRILLEHTGEIVNGVKILLGATGLKKAVFAVEKSREEEAEALMALCGASLHFGISVVKSKYPGDEERQLVEALTGKRPEPGKSALESGFLILGAECVWAVYRAFVEGAPVTERILTVSGDAVEKPRNVRVPIGASFDDVLRFCGGLVKPKPLLLNGGVMRGKAIANASLPVDKNTSAVTALSDDSLPGKETPCIKCGRCVKVCPERLYPLYIARAVDRGAWQNARSWDADACTECGCCAYVCPARIPLPDKIRLAKNPPVKKKEAE